MTRDRRAVQRVNVAIRPWRVDLLGEPAAPGSLGGVVEILDLSSTGARLSIAGDVHVDDRLALDFQYRNRRFTVPGRVVWARAEEDEPEEREVGLVFEDVPALTQARLESVLGRQAALNRSLPGAGAAAS